MAIDYFGHCACELAETRQRLAYLRRQRPEWYGVVLELHEPSDPGPFGVEIALEFGIAARCRFLMHVLDKQRLAAVGDAVEFVYRVFGTDSLVVTCATDTIRPPLAKYEAMDIGEPPETATRSR